jgi:UDP-N-acetylglucosamine pyrophosphorylase
MIPWATNLYTETLIEKVNDQFGKDFWGFWMLGGMSGGGMGFIFHPNKKIKAQECLQIIMSETKKKLERAVPFAIEPVVYDFAINEKGTTAKLLIGPDDVMPIGYYLLTIPNLLKIDTRKLTQFQQNELSRFSRACITNPRFFQMTQDLFDRLLPQAKLDQQEHKNLSELLDIYGFDKEQHEKIRSDLRSGRIGLAQNRLPVSSKIEDVKREDVFFAVDKLPQTYYNEGIEALSEGAVAVVSLAGGAGSRWTKGAGVVKALHPFCKLGGKHRNFVEVHLAKSRKISTLCRNKLTHIITTSYLTHDPISDYLNEENNYNYPGNLVLSPGKFVGLRLIPMARDLRFAWEEMPQQLLDEQAQKVRDSLHNALIGWAQQMGEGTDYTDNLPSQCLHPVGHWYEIPNLLRNGVLASVVGQQPKLKYLMIHNIDTLGANIDPSILGYFITSRNDMATEVITKRMDDRGGGLAKIDGQIRLIEGLALPHEKIEFNLSFYNTSTTWVAIDQLLKLFSLNRDDLNDESKVTLAIRNIAERMPTYITLKDVKKRWGRGQEDIYPVTQFEKLWGDMSALPDIKSSFIVVPRIRGQQLKEVSQLDSWLRDGSADYLESICDWEDG